MSKIYRSKFRLIAVFIATLQFFTISFAQDLEASLKFKSINPPILSIEGKISEKNRSKNWSFLDSIAGIENLSARIKDFSLFDQNGQKIAVKNIAAGEYSAEDFAENFSYKIDLSRYEKIASMAHISCFFEEKGLLMLDDLLPQFQQKTSAKIKFELPSGWRIKGNEKLLAENFFTVENIEKAVFFIGKNWRERKIEKLNFLTADEWQFSEDEAMISAEEILREYQKIFGEIPFQHSQIFLLKFPSGTSFGNWEAETRGTNIIILSSDMPFKSQSIQRLHEQLRHEIFHLWMPNNLALTGNYAWFYEGFALYQSLRVGVELNRLRFEDFLDTLSRAYNLDNFQTQRQSLIEGSKNRWKGANSQVYARGMLAAFLCDIALLKESKGKRSLTEILREIYQKHKKTSPETYANSAILGILEARHELRPIVEKYVKGKENIAWQTDLEAFGIESVEENSFVKLSVKSKLNGRQKDLLDKLGYNNWRKIVQKTK